MTTVKEKISAKSRNIHIILNEIPHSKSYAALILLNHYYQELDIDYSQENDWRYLFIVRRHFLRKRKKVNGGHWICHYCGEPVYKMQKRNTKHFQKGCITVDHKNAISKGGPILSTKNMVESCQKCNRDKGTMSYEKFLKKKQKHNELS